MLKRTITILLAAGLTLLAAQLHAQEAITSDPDAVSWGPDRVDIFSRGNPDGLWHNWGESNSWGGAENLGGGLIGGPGVSSWGAGRLDIFVRGTTSALFHKVYDNAWYDWEQLSPDNTLASDPAAVAWSQDRIDVFAKGNPNGLWHTWWDRNGGWGNGENLGGGLIGGPGVASWGSGRLDVFVQGDNGALFHKVYDGTWREWEQLGPAGALGSDPTAVSWGPNRIDVFAKGAQNGLWHMAWDGSRWVGPENLGGNLGSGPGVSSKGVGKLQVFAADGNNPGKLMVKTFDEQGWREWAPVVSVAAAITKQIVPINQNDPVLVELVTVTQYPGKLQHLSLETPPGFSVVSMTPSDSDCPNTPGSGCKQRWLWGLNPGQNCTLNGDYKANFDIVCASGANCGAQPYSVPFSLQSENFCAEYSVNTSQLWQQVNGIYANDVGVVGETLMWLVTRTAIPGGYEMITLDMNSAAGMKRPGAAMRITGGSDDSWHINEAGNIYRWVNGNWSQVSGTARDIGVGGGIAWHIGSNAVAGGFGIWQQSGSGWTSIPGGAVRIDVDPSGKAWVVNDAGNIFRYTGSGWEQVTAGVKARDIGVGDNGSVFIAGADGQAYKWNGSGWEPRGGGDIAQIAVGGQGTPVAITADGGVWLGQP